ncbi:MAG: hypothetical protein M1829_002914 [Trizodia sp. TS-e1964]|nr:MAG: hypothetical protein M1829_002914 [Trizodia sp. TS-e1964]
MAPGVPDFCLDFKLGRCRRGAKCKFSHGEGLTNTGSSPTTNALFREESATEALSRRWTHMIPRPNAVSLRHASAVDETRFFQMGWSLIDSGDPGTRQYVITKLAAETGLAIIKALTHSTDATYEDGVMALIFKDRVLPFFRIISHPDVLMSLILETPVDTIYTFLFGPGGRRGLCLFRFTATALSHMISGDPSNDEEFSSIALVSSLAVLERLIEINQSAQVIEGFIPIVETISACILENSLPPIGQKSLNRIRARLSIGVALPQVTVKLAPTNQPLPVFKLTQDLPGHLSEEGARHDNDHINISDIQILPTAQEISSTRQEYLPPLNFKQQHQTDLAALLDRQFRLLREDTVGQLRDAVREEMKRGTFSDLKSSSQKGVRKIAYTNVSLARLFLDRRKGLQVLAEFDQPPHIRRKSLKQRENWWNASKLLQVDSLVCFASRDSKIIFLSVCDATSSSHWKNSSNKVNGDNEKKDEEQVPSLTKDSDRASVLLSLAEYQSADIFWISTHIGTRLKDRQSLIEFPGILLPSFQPTLQALQNLSKTLNLSFADVLAPKSTDSNPLMKPPAYALKTNFSFNLDVLAGEPLTLEPGRAFDFHKLNEGSTLDVAQQNAVIRALSTELALIQGPPGTGKSYTGAAIIKTLLHNRKAADLGPIICVCYTNHALDQVLEHLVKDDVKQIIRLGSRSKSEILQNLTLHNVVKDVVPTKTEKHDKWEHNQAISETLREAEGLLPGLNNPNSWTNMEAHLKSYHINHYHELFGKREDKDRFQEVQGKKSKAINRWIQGAPKDLISNRPVAQLMDLPQREMSSLERAALYKHWIKERSAQLASDLIYELDSFNKSKSALNKCHSELDLQCLREAHIIGVTTSGLARNIEILGRLRAKVMLCEEAGEVLEAHTLTAFLPSVEHAILIGDHEQLRPQINNYELQHDSPRGKQYSLDISLFERLVRPQIGDFRVPLSSLNIQRRMHPSISDLIRVPLYPNLQDHPSVAEYPEVDGMRDRLYWFDHKNLEDPRPPHSISLSRTNSFEVEMIAALTQHLVRQGAYSNEDIAVITPYLGQLQEIKKRLANSFEIVIGDRDLEELEAKGFQDNETPIFNGHVHVQKTTLLKSILLSTVDNFQGCEASVVLVSLVRSNDERKCGFLRTSNRINVLLSRAKHGMYIIGNADTSRHVDMWNQVISILENSNCIGPTLSLSCARHKETLIEVSVPDDFARFAPEGGCAKRCSSRLSCGHSCINMCHSNSLHNAVRCLERCQRSIKGCKHECPRYCGDTCNPYCQVILFDIPLPCGHVASSLKCHEAQSPEAVRCEVLTSQVMQRCKHTIKVHCYELPLSLSYPCSATCGAMLSCGHSCLCPCKGCNIFVDERNSAINHGICKSPCGRPFTTCSHSCKAFCHGDSPCSPCTDPCEVSCNHSKCGKSCNEPCVPCAEDCSWSCPHRGRCPLPCAAPCDMLPCSERCANTLSCGHQCPSICGEDCPSVKYCQICADSNVKEMVVDFILASTFEEVDLDTDRCIVPLCGHILTLESMDGHMSMPDFYTIDINGSITGLKNSAEPFSASAMKSCPTCRRPLQNLNRYSRIVRRALIDEATKKFIVWANRQFVPLATKMQKLETKHQDASEEGLSRTQRATLEAAMSGSIQLQGSHEAQFAQITYVVRREQRYRPVKLLRNQIKDFLKLVDEKEQPFGRIYDLVQDIRRHRGINVNLNAPVDILQVRNRLLATVLLFQCDYAILSIFLNEIKEIIGVSSLNIVVDLSANRKDCEDLIAESRLRKQPRNEVEGHIYWARFFSLERSFAEPEQEIEYLMEEARERLDVASWVCNTYPGQTTGMKSEIEDVQKMLRGSTFYMPVSNKEKAAVYAAMALDFGGTGHWYYCVNGHPFTVGECGMPMQTSLCPQCGSPVGGTHHQPVEGVRRATDMEEQFGTGLEWRFAAARIG